jgi:hypothetical protein
MTWGIFKKDSVSEAYAKMKAEELKGKQHKLDVNKNSKVDGDDLAKLRAQKEDTEISAEELVEYEAKDGVYKHQAKAGRYGGSEKESDYVKGPSNAALKKIESEKNKKKNESFDESNLELIEDDVWYDGSDMLGEAQARYSQSYQFTHKPGDEESEKKLSDLKKSVKGTGKRVVLQGRLGKNNPNAHKYSKNAPQGTYANGKRTNSDVSGKSGAHTHQRIQKADAAHHDVYVYDKSDVQYDADTMISELSIDKLKSYINKAKPEVQNAKAERQSARDSGDGKGANDAYQLAKKRTAGIKQAKAKLNKEGLDLFSEKEIDMLINEVLSKDASAGEWISDFVKSDNPKFAGKSKEQRKKQALGAYYAAQRNESNNYESFLVLDEAKQDDIVKMGAKEIKHANMKDKQNDQEVMEPHSGTEAKFIDSHSIRVQDDPTQGKFDSGTGKVGTATAPTGKGPGSYDAKEKLGNQKTGVKEEVYKTAAGEEIDTEPTEKKAGDKKKFGSFKASMNKEASDCKTKQ